MTTNNKISTIVSSQVPFFVRNDHPGIVKFLEKYYEFLEQNGQTIDGIKNLKSYDDIDKTTDVLAERFYKHFLVHIPDWAIVDKRLITKHVKDFYTSRGTERSIEFLINILFGKQTDFYYPKQDVLRASDGRWYIEKSLKLRDVKVNGEVSTDISLLDYMVNKTIKGNTSNATAVVESVSIYYEKLSLVKEIKLSSQTKDFSTGEEIFTTFTREGQEYSLTANVFSGFISSLNLIDPGAGYSAGTVVPVESNTGNGAIVVIDSVSRGNIKSLSLVYGGAGFSVNDAITFTGGDGVGANAYVISVDTSGAIHPNSYNIIVSNINSYAANVISQFASNTFINAGFQFATFNLGPILELRIIDGGENYLTIPTIDVTSNSLIRSLNILGRMEIENGGTGYEVNDYIEFINYPGGYGYGANAIVTSVNATGAITGVAFIPVANQITGGSGYNILPQANVISANGGSNAHILVTSVLGDGEIITATTDTIGKIEKLRLVEGGSGYVTPPSIRLDEYGDGKAQVAATIITGIFTYPGRFISDSGLLSSHMYLQDGTYYHNYSYVVRTPVALDRYKKTLLELIHPSGLKLFADYIFEDRDGTINVAAKAANTSGYSNLAYDYIYTGNPYSLVANSNANINTSDMIITFNAHPFSTAQTVVLKFDTSSIMNTIVSISSTQQNTFNVIYPSRVTATGNVSVGLIL